MADIRSSLVQIHQDVLDVTNQALKVSVVADSTGGGGAEAEMLTFPQLSMLATRLHHHLAQMASLQVHRLTQKTLQPSVYQ